MTLSKIRRLVGPNREADAEIWRRAGMEGEATRLTASVDAGLALAEWLWPDVKWRMATNGPTSRVTLDSGSRMAGEAHVTLPLAICAAIIAMLESEGR